MKAIRYGAIFALAVLLLYSSNAPVQGFRTIFPTVHQDITADALSFLKPFPLFRVILGNRSTDDPLTERGRKTRKQSKYHFDNCRFSESTKTINDAYELAVKQLNPNGSYPTSDAQETFGNLLHTVQDFYSHSNWVELREAGKIPNNIRLIDQGDGLWTELHPPSESDPMKTVRGIMVIEGADGDFEALGLTLARSKGERVVTVHKGPDGESTPISPGLISGVHNNDDLSNCPETVAMEHGPLFLAEDRHLSKDFPSRPYHRAAKELAIEQTTHEWCLLVNLVREKYGDKGVKDHLITG